MDKKAFTFGVLTYNQQDLVVETLNSILYQKKTYGMGVDVDLIITDDNSKDNTQQVIEDWIREYGNSFRKITKLFNEENKGTVNNYNYILENVDGNSLKIIAGDDVISSINIFEECEKLDDNTLSTYIRIDLLEGRLVMNQRSIEHFYWNQSRLKKEKLLSRFRMGGLLHTPSTLYTKNNYIKSNAKELNSKFRLFEDDPTWYSMIKNNADLNLKFLSKIIVLYRVHSGSISNQGAKETPFSKELRQLKRIYMSDSTGIEYLRHKSAFENWPKYISLDRICRVVNEIYIHYRLLFDNNYKAFVTNVKKQMREEQLYYNGIKDGSIFSNNARI